MRLNSERSLISIKLQVLHPQDITGNVWTGHRDGYVRVWGEASHNPVCAPFRATHSDIKCGSSTCDASALSRLSYIPTPNQQRTMHVSDSCQ